LVLLALLAGCASTHVRDVTQMVTSYKVGVTRFEDFKKDAKLVEIQVFSGHGPKYATLKSSSFAIIDQNTDISLKDGQESSRDFVVGDASGKICIIGFSIHDGKLTKLSPE
jgi:major membrane immunogen (membrane-anchored lipoprotein)